MIFLVACIIFLLISTATFFTYFYYRSFGTKIHYAYLFSAVVFCLVSLAMTLLCTIWFFMDDEKDSKDVGGFLIILLSFLSIYQSYMIYVLIKIFFLK